jgi:hypothetical protein
MCVCIAQVSTLYRMTSPIPLCPRWATHFGGPSRGCGSEPRHVASCTPFAELDKNIAGNRFGGASRIYVAMPPQDHCLTFGCREMQTVRCNNIGELSKESWPIRHKLL